ncbi:MAG: DUF4351 domain-containing protein, partial [Dolichospermum sp.]
MKPLLEILIQEKKVRLLTIPELESLGEALLDFQNMS